MILTVSVVVPMKDNQSTVKKTLESLFAQKEFFNELIVIDSNSCDDSVSVAKEFLNNNGDKTSSLLINEPSAGLAAAYNKGVKAAICDLVVILHADVVLMPDALKRLTDPFSGDLSGSVVAATHCVIHPYDIWASYTFWQKCFFARLVGKKFSGIDGKFDCFRKSALLKANLFASNIFKSAGEDGDMVYKLSKIGKIVQTEATIIHLHTLDRSFGLKKLIYKHFQYSEAQGALLRLGRIDTLARGIKTFFREILLSLLIIPYLQYVAFVIVILYSFVHTLPMYTKVYKNPLIAILPVLNILLLFVGLAGSVTGFIHGKQSH